MQKLVVKISLIDLWKSLQVYAGVVEKTTLMFQAFSIFCSSMMFL
jgi:hypothetical protein